MGCLKLHTEENYTTLKVVYTVYKSCVLTEQEEKNKSTFLEVVYSVAQSNGGRNYGGDGSGSFGDKSMQVMDGLNSINPVALLWDAVTYAYSGKDRLGNKMSLAEATIKAAGVLPIGKIGGSGINMYKSLGAKFGSGYSSVSVMQGKYMGIEVGQKLNQLSPGVWSKVYEAGMLNGAKVETHYFYNATTGEYANPFIKWSGWGSF